MTAAAAGPYEPGPGGAHRKGRGARVGYRDRVTAPAPRPRDFRDATPREIRDALIPEEAVEFDQQWQASMARATETLDLADVFMTLECWRRIAMMTAAHGHDAHRQMLRRAAERFTGEAIPADEPVSVTKARIGI